MLNVVDGAQLDHRAVPADENIGDCHQGIALVALAAQLLQRIVIVWQGAEAILCLHHPVLGGLAKPGAGFIIPLGLGRVVVAVGILSVGVPLGLGAHFSILVCDQDMALAGSLRGQLKGHIFPVLLLSISEGSHLAVVPS